MTAATVMLVDDHALVRAGFRSLLESIEGVSVVAEADDSRSALRLIDEHRPDVVFLDIAMPGLSGLEIIPRVARDHPGVRVVILSMHAGEEYVLRALEAGAAGYILKHATFSEFQRALKAVMRGETYLSPLISERVVDAYVARTGARRNASGSGPPALTPRQTEILRLIGEGVSTKEIAHLLSISVKTVEAHRSQLMDRLGIHDLAGLVKYAIRAGLVNPEP